MYKYFYIIFVCTRVLKKERKKNTTHSNGWALVGSVVRCVVIS